jgi:multiple antibiotic resistance protein
MGQAIAYYFAALLVIVDPIGTAALFLGLTRGVSSAERRRLALRGVTIAGVVLLVFAFTGDFLLRALGIGLPAFRIAGGSLLFLLAIDMLLAGQPGFRHLTESESREAGEGHDISVFPLAIPVIAGPGALTTMVLLMGGVEGNALGQGVVIVVLVAVLLIMLAALLTAGQLLSVLGRTGVNVVSRVLGILLAALAVQLVLDGLTAALRLPTS